MVHRVGVNADRLLVADELDFTIQLSNVMLRLRTDLAQF